MRKIKKVMLIGLSCALALSLTACGTDTNKSDGKVPDPANIKSEKVTAAQWLSAFDFSSVTNISLKMINEIDDSDGHESAEATVLFDGSKCQMTALEKGRTKERYYATVDGINYDYTKDVDTQKWSRTEGRDGIYYGFAVYIEHYFPNDIATKFSDFEYNSNKAAYIGEIEDDEYSVKITKGKVSYLQYSHIDSDSNTTYNYSFQIYNIGSTRVTLPKCEIEQTPDNKDKTGNEVGDIAPDFTVERYGSSGTFNLYANHGKVTVINFWATWCTPCVEEIPYFNELAENYPELDVIAIHGAYTGQQTKADIAQYIVDKGWGNFTLNFAQDNLESKMCLTFSLLGGTSLWPMTVIVDEDGKIIYRDTQSFSNYEQLKSLVMGLIG